MALHVGIFAFLAFVGFFDDPPVEDQKFEVSMKVLPPKEVEEEPEPEPEALPEPEPEPEKVVVPEEPAVLLTKQTVVQETNSEVPEEESRYMSESANRVEEETRALETSLDVPTNSDLPVKEESIPESGEGGDASETAEVEQEAQEAQEAVPEVELRRSLFQPDLARMERIVGRDGAAEKEERSAKRGPKLLSNFEASQVAIKASFENFIPEIKIGNHTAVNAHANPAATYLARIHAQIHRQWADGYLMYLDTREPMSSPLQDPDLHTKLEYVIDANSGEVEKVNIVETSGNSAYDAAAITISFAAGPHRAPPADVVSPNGKVYVHWNFWRNQKQCGIFGAEVFLLDKDG